MAKKKKPYLGYSEDEVNRMERGYFVLQFGGDFVIQDQFYLFTDKEVSRLYNSTLRNLIDIVNEGDEKDRNYALGLIPGLKIQPMRLH